MWQIIFWACFISFCIFAVIMLAEPRTLWSGVSFFVTMMWLALSVVFFFLQHSEWLKGHRAVSAVLTVLLVLAITFVLAFPALLVLVFFIEGLKMILHEGRKLSNLLSLLFSILLCAYISVWPMVGNLQKNTVSTRLYAAITFFAMYVLSLMAMYVLSAILNLIHFRRRKLDYIVVLGCGIRGKEVTPLLAGRVDKGIKLLQRNPGARLILSGGQGSGEEIPESEAMAAYAAKQGVERDRIITEELSVSTEENLMFSARLMEGKKPKVALVTTSYHVFRALILARKQKLKCIGFGAGTKWYFTLNALIREFVGYLSITWKWHAAVAGILAWGVVIAAI